MELNLHRQTGVGLSEFFFYFSLLLFFSTIFFFNVEPRKRVDIAHEKTFGSIRERSGDMSEL